jgi:hypothetical protein
VPPNTAPSVLPGAGPSALPVLSPGALPSGGTVLLPVPTERFSSAGPSTDPSADLASSRVPSQRSALVHHSVAPWLHRAAVRLHCHGCTKLVTDEWTVLHRRASASPAVAQMHLRVLVPSAFTVRTGGTVVYLVRCRVVDPVLLPV